MQTLKVRTNQETEFVEITRDIRSAVRSMELIQGGICVYVPHTTAGVTINENADPTVLHDLRQDLERLIPRGQSYYQHREGNSASHVKASLFGSSVIIMVEQGELILGTWQGVFLCEFDGPRTRKVHIQAL